MNYQRFIEGQTFIVRWRMPTAEASGRLADEVVLHHERLGEPLLLGLLVGPDSPPPDPATSEALIEGHDRVFDCCIGIRLVFFGQTLQAALMRSVVAGMIVATGLRGKGFAVDKSIAALARVNHNTTGMLPGDLVRGLEAAEMLEPEEVTRALAELRA